MHTSLSEEPAGAFRWLVAPNPSPMTLDGTRTFIVGRRRAVVIDPGPAHAGHLDALAAALADARVSAVLLTHAHPDHAAGANTIAHRLGARVYGCAAGTLDDGAAFETDAGPVRALHTPGHTRDHACFHWADGAAVFVGDLLMGGQNTALIAPPDGDLGAYLDSLERVRALDARVLYPAHGPPFDDPAAAIDAYVQHRAARERQVLQALDAGPADEVAIVERVYGATLDPALANAARGAVAAYLAHLEARGRVRRTAAGWATVD